MISMAFLTFLVQRILGYVHIHKGLNWVGFVGTPLSDYCEKESNSRTIFKYKGFMKTFIKVTMGVRQGCIISPTIFLLVLDNVMRKTTSTRQRGIQWGMMARLEDLDYAHNICSKGQRLHDMEEKLTNQQEAKQKCK
jgi:hypothetical protein